MWSRRWPRLRARARVPPQELYRRPSQGNHDGTNSERMTENGGRSDIITAAVVGSKRRNVFGPEEKHLIKPREKRACNCPVRTWRAFDIRWQRDSDQPKIKTIYVLGPTVRNGPAFGDNVIFFLLVTCSPSVWRRRRHVQQQYQHHHQSALCRSGNRSVAAWLRSSEIQIRQYS